MKKEKRKLYLKIIIVLALIGLATSVYLVQNHFAPPKEGALCDLGETISCSLVNTSVFSELFNIPVAFLGGLWFVVLLMMAWKSLGKDNSLPKIMFLWSIIGFLFVIYMIIAELILKAICPFCTVVHVIVLIILFLSYRLYKSQKSQPHKKEFSKKLRNWIIFIVIINLLPLWIFNTGTNGADGQYDALAQCLSDKEINMYSSFRCGFCARTKSNFGSSMQYINEIECHPQGPNSQIDLCTSKDISGTPTWILEPSGVEVKRNTGYLTIDELRTFSGCEE